MTTRASGAVSDETKWRDGPTDIVVTPDQRDAARTFPPELTHADLTTRCGADGCGEKDS